MLVAFSVLLHPSPPHLLIEGGAKFFVQNDATITVYLMDQRGVGLSSPVSCTDPPGENFDPGNTSLVRATRYCFFSYMPRVWLIIAVVHSLKCGAVPPLVVTPLHLSYLRAALTRECTRSR